MRRFVQLACVTAFVAGAGAIAPLAAQQATPVAPVKPDTSRTAVQAAAAAAADSAAKDLARAVAALAVSVQQIVTETANKPEVRLAAVQVASRAVSVAQKTLADNMSEIEKALAEATRMLADLEAAQKAKVEKP